MKRFTVPVVLGVLVTLFVTTLASAAPRFGGRGPENAWGLQEGRGMRWGLGSITLSDEQKAKILDIEKNFLTKAADLKAQIQAKVLELRELKLKEATQEVAESIRAKIKEILDLQGELSALRKDMYQQILNVLTPEQLKNLPPFGWGMGERGPEGFCPRFF
uniref:Periplasmic heavy metal sensor n=1 Tax=Candidatus Caldatribacterium californiense TaxID=1454726 RepID=A0A7V3YMJ4_9BACT